MVILDSPYNLWSLLIIQLEHPRRAEAAAAVPGQEAAPEWSDTLCRRDGALSALAKSKRASAVPAGHVRPAPSPRNYLQDDTVPLAAVQLRALNHATISARNSISNCSNVSYRHWSRNKVGWAKCIFIFSFCILCIPIRESFSCLNKYKWH